MIAESKIAVEVKVKTAEVETAVKVEVEVETAVEEIVVIEETGRDLADPARVPGEGEDAGAALDRDQETDRETDRMIEKEIETEEGHETDPETVHAEEEELVPLLEETEGEDLPQEIEETGQEVKEEVEGAGLALKTDEGLVAIRPPEEDAAIELPRRTGERDPTLVNAEHRNLRNHRHQLHPRWVKCQSGSMIVASEKLLSV